MIVVDHGKKGEEEDEEDEEEKEKNDFVAVGRVNIECSPKKAIQGKDAEGHGQSKSEI